MTPLEEALRNLRSAMLTAMASLTPASDPGEVRRCNGVWKRLRSEAVKGAVEAGEAMRYLKDRIVNQPEFKRFLRLRDPINHGSDQYKARRREYARTRYIEVTKARRAAPEAREKLNAQKRERYQRSKLASAIEPPPIAVELEHETPDDAADSILALAGITDGMPENPDEAADSILALAGIGGPS